MTESHSRTDHSWTFFRAGGIDQVLLQSPADLANLKHLDKKLWTALSCPVQGLECDEQTLNLIDFDRDGKVRVPELLAAIEWTLERLSDPSVLTDGVSRFDISKINTQTSEGRALRDAAVAILKNLGSDDLTQIGVKETSKRAEIFGQAKFNGDGVVPPASASDAETAQAISDIISCMGGVEDRNGSLGVNRALVDSFFDQLERYSNEMQQGAVETSPVSFEAYQKLKEKLEDYFARCRILEYDSAATEPLNKHLETYASLRATDLSRLPASLKQMPIARPNGEAVLNLDEGINPAWREEVEDFRVAILGKLSGVDRSRLDAGLWQSIKKRFEVSELQSKAIESFQVSKLDAERIQELNTPEIRESLLALIEEDEALADEVAIVDDLDRLVRYQKDLLLICRNFVNFSDFFDLNQAAIFQAGTLYIDSRGCELCVRISNPTAHAALASLSRCCLLYCECVRAGSEPIQIAAVLSNGDSDHIMVGRNGVFYDRDGHDWHARIVKVIENPISIRQAFWSPYKKLARFIDTVITKRAEAAEKATVDKLASAADAIGNADKSDNKPQKIEVGTVAAIGVAIGSIGTFVSMLLVRAVSLGPWLPLALVSIVFMISLPSMFLAYLRLRQRTLGPILDATGWAVNGQIKISRKLGRMLTHIRKIPLGSKRSIKHSKSNGSDGLLFVVFVLVLVAIATVGGLYFKNLEQVKLGDTELLRETPASAVEPSPSGEGP